MSKQECERKGYSKAECEKMEHIQRKEEPGFLEGVKDTIVEGANKVGEVLSDAYAKTKEFFDVGTEQANSEFKKDELKDRDLQNKSEQKEPIINQSENKNLHQNLPKDQHIHNKDYFKDVKEKSDVKEEDFPKTRENLNKIPATGSHDVGFKENFTEGNQNFYQPKSEDKNLQNMNLGADKNLSNQDNLNNFNKSSQEKSNFNKTNLNQNDQFEKSGNNQNFKKIEDKNLHHTTEGLQNLNLGADKDIKNQENLDNFSKNRLDTNNYNKPSLNQNDEIENTGVEASTSYKKGPFKDKSENYNKDFQDEQNINAELKNVQDTHLPKNELTSGTNLLHDEKPIHQDEKIVGLGKAQAERNMPQGDVHKDKVL